MFELSDTLPQVTANSHLVLLTDHKILCRNSVAPWQPFSPQTIPALPRTDFDHYPLGDFQGRPCHLLYFSDSWEPEADCSWETIRSIVLRGELEGAAFSLVSTALQVQNWSRDHQFCGRCGAATTVHQTERAMVCTSCEIHYYPRLSPCIITVITRDEHCLLAHNSKFKSGYFSALAGFVEPGETVEQCLHREVMEEVGLAVKNLRYFGSQPWPFPGQLMIGFLAEYDSGEICVDGDEITEAHWWHYRQLPATPPPTTLSGQLIRAFVEGCQNAETGSAPGADAPAQGDSHVL